MAAIASETTAASELYLDNNATTPVAAEVIAAVAGTLATAWANPSSAHGPGLAARAVLDDARRWTALALGSNSTSDIVFTSGGTESNNLVLHSAVEHAQAAIRAAQAAEATEAADAATAGKPAAAPSANSSAQRPHVILTSIEHPATLRPAQVLAERGAITLTVLPASLANGSVTAAQVSQALQPSTCLVSVMLVNNETGCVADLAAICRVVRDWEQASAPSGSATAAGPASTGVPRRVFVHTDAAQALGKIPVNVELLGVDYATIAGHKFYGPRIGAVYARGLAANHTPLFPMLFGGGQERGIRPGTENTPMIAGFGKACELIVQHLSEYQRAMSKVMNALEAALEATCPAHLAVIFHGKQAVHGRSPNTTNFSVVERSLLCSRESGSGSSASGLAGPSRLGSWKLVERLSDAQIYVSRGAACHSGSHGGGDPEPSPILLAYGVEHGIAQNALRVSIGRETTVADVQRFVAALWDACNHVLSQ
ncbi:pyridoxal phosphate-dependent transferase [Entophlyctis helioformis]|nr:pyridoxal phosphate-dependent transferase [Entophlyctis helioformis]